MRAANIKRIDKDLIGNSKLDLVKRIIAQELPNANNTKIICYKQV